MKESLVEMLLVGAPLAFGLIAYLFHLNQRKLKQLLNAQAQILQISKMSALGEMAGGIAHEINTPLAIITTLSGQLREYVLEKPLDAAAIGEAAQGIEATAVRIGEIIRGLRSFSRDGSRDSFSKVSLRNIIQDTLSLCGERFKQHGIDLIIDEIPADLKVECRAAQLSQVLLNLLNNAHDAVLGKAGAKWVRFSVKDLSDKVEIGVMDSGNGIPVSVRSKMFQPFFTTKEIGKGAGLGLSISKGLIEGHRGEIKIDVESTNTRFLIRMPKTQPEKRSVA